MQSFEWISAWWKHFATQQTHLQVMVVRNEADQLIGIVPWFRRSNLAIGKTVGFLGSDRACSDYQSILCSQGSEEQVIGAIVDGLTGSLRSHWQLLDLDGVAASDTAMKMFIERMADRGHVIHRRESQSTWRIDIGGGWQGFLDKQSKSQRSQFRNFINRFDKSSDLRWRLASQEPTDMEAMIASLMKLHQMRWNAAGQAGCFADPRMKGFFVEAMQTMIPHGSADVSLIERDGRPVAGMAWLLKDRVAFGYQCGRDPSEDDNRIGRIANAVGIRWAAEKGFETFDLLRGDEAYKSQMRAIPTECQRVRIVARATSAQLRHNIWLACREVKSRCLSNRWPAISMAGQQSGVQSTPKLSSNP
jgi:CelD/BcsL family acetyltransferase involved in cellulose biosynthesis